MIYYKEFFALIVCFTLILPLSNYYHKFGPKMTLYGCANTNLNGDLSEVTLKGSQTSGFGHLRSTMTLKVSLVDWDTCFSQCGFLYCL